MSIVDKSIAGALSGSFTVLALQPLDVIHTRLQLNLATTNTQQSRLNHVVRALWKEGAGTPRAFWRGSIPSLWRAVPGVTLYFGFLNMFSTLMNPHHTSLSALLAGSSARASVALLLNPFTVLKTRVEASSLPSVSAIGMLRQMTPRELYSGLAPTIARDAPFSGLSFLFYTGLCRSLGCSVGVVGQQGSDALGLHFFAGLVSGLCATLITHPADVIKTRMQLPGPKPGALGLIVMIVHTHGYRGFFSGMGPRLVRRALLTATTWSAFEEILGRLKKMRVG